MKKKNIILLITAILVVIAIIIGVVIKLNDKPKEKTDAEKFIDKIINILEKGTGIVYLGFPECPWCQTYVKYLNEVAMDLGIEKIYYYNIREDRSNNTEEYQKIVSILENYLQNDEEGNKRIYVPSVITLKKGEIVGFDDETAWDTKGFSTPEEYWTEDELKDLKEKLETMIIATEMNICTECE